MAIVVSHTSVTPEYFKNEMDATELNYIIKEINSKEQGRWIKMRWIGYVFAKCLTGKPNSPKELVSFDWESSQQVENKIDTKTQMQESLAAFEMIKDKL